MERETQLPWAEWKVDSRIGTGTFGEVYRVCKSEYGHISEAAVKVIRIRVDEHKKAEIEVNGISFSEYIQEIQNSIVKEIDIMDSLKGAAHIVSIEDSRILREEDGWTVYIRMELLENLIQIQKTKRFYLNDVIRLGCDLCEGLEACEKKGIIHRDIKPANIFWSELGGYKLGDFGISRYLGSTMGGVTRAGTATYMAPEISRGENYGKTIDIYSLGLVLYQLANTGRLPFIPLKRHEGDLVTVRMVEEAHERRMAGEVFPNPFLGGYRLGDVLRKACAFRPEDRYQSALEMKKALLACINEEDPVKLREEDPQEDRTVVIDRKELQKPVQPLKKGKKKILVISCGALMLVTALLYMGSRRLQDRAFQNAISEDEASQDKVSEGETFQDEASQDRISEGETSQDKVSEDETLSQDEASQDETPQDKVSEDTISQNEISQNETPDEEAEEVSLSDKKEETEKKQDGVMCSQRMWEKDGQIYTVYKVEEDGFVSISGNYVDTMIVYGDKIYWRKNSGIENVPCSVICMNLDKSEQKVLTENAYSSSVLSIADGWLYYIAVDDHGDKKSRRINLETGNEEDAPPYFFRNGSDKVWFSTSLEDGSWYQSEPGFKNLRHVEEDFEIRLGVIGYKFYYMHQMEDGTYTTYSYDAQSGDMEIILRNQYAKSILNGDRLYFKQVKNGNTILYEMNPETGEKESYNLGDFHLYMGGGLYGLKDKICLMKFCPERKENNTEFWTLDRESGQTKVIGQWYNSNAVNAAKEP